MNTNMIDVPATLPGSMKDQIKALAPYIISYALKANGGFVAEMKIPIDAFVTFDINHTELATHGMSLSVQVERPEGIGSGPCGRVVRHAQYADVQLTYK